MEHYVYPKGKDPWRQENPCRCTKGARSRVGSTPVLWSTMRWAEQSTEENNRQGAVWNKPILKKHYKTPELKGSWTEKFVVDENIEPVEVIVCKPTLLLNKLLSCTEVSLVPGSLREESPKVKDESIHKSI